MDFLTSERKRPVYVTAISVVLVCVGIAMFFIKTLPALPMILAGGPLLARFAMLYISLIWIAIAVGGVGLFQGSAWARPVVALALVGLWIVTSFSPFATNSQTVLKALVYFALLLPLFTSKSNRYFRGNGAEQIERVEPAMK